MDTANRGLEPRDPGWEARLRASFARQAFMRLIGAGIVELAPGAVDVAVSRRAELCQQHGYIHAGITASIADSAAGYAALSLYRAGYGVLTTEFKVNLLNPATGSRLVARGRVIKPGRTLSVCRSEVYGVEDGLEVHIATGLFTMIAVAGLDD